MKVQLHLFLQTDLWEDFETKKVVAPKIFPLHLHLKEFMFLVCRIPAVSSYSDFFLFHSFFFNEYLIPGRMFSN